MQSNLDTYPLTKPLAGILCLFGFFLHIFLSDPLLNTLGFHYSGEQGQFFEKIHPGTWFMLLSLAVLLLQRGNPFATSYGIAKAQPIFAALFCTTVLMFGYVVLRSGAAGTAFLIDTHITVPICATVICATPLTIQRYALHCFIAAAALNSIIGIAEGMVQWRLFTFDADWTVLHEEHFRSSALRGHPLNNAMFTAIALFTLLAMHDRRWLTTILSVIAMVSLVAFGGRAALFYSTLGLLLWLTIAVWRRFKGQLLVMLLVYIGMTLTMFFSLYSLLGSGIGERIAAHGWWDASADSRLLAPLVFDAMQPHELIFGVSTDRIVAITADVNQRVALSYIENPWLLMLMHLGAVMFVLWLSATLAFIWRLMRGQSLAVMLTVLAYFAIASTSNSFGRKDSTYLIMVCAVMCLAQTANGYTNRETCHPGAGRDPCA